MITLWIGVLGCLFSFSFGILVGIAKLMGFVDVPGYATIVILIMFMSSLILAVQGIMGAYIWRTFENTKRRPLGIVSTTVVVKPT